MRKQIGIIAAFLILLGSSGCTSRNFYTHTDGENDLVGIELPGDSQVKFNLVHHINGDQLTIKENSRIDHTYSVTNSNSYFGIIHINEIRSGHIVVNPTNRISEASN